MLKFLITSLSCQQRFNCSSTASPIKERKTRKDRERMRRKKKKGKMVLSLLPPTSHRFSAECNFPNCRHYLRVTMHSTPSHLYSPLSLFRFIHWPPLSLALCSHCSQNPITTSDCCCRRFAPPMEQLALPAMTVTTTPTPDPAPLQPFGAPFHPPVAGTSVILSPEQKQAMQLRAFWASQKADIQQMEEVKSHSLPLTRIKKIMKADEDVKMIAGEAPVVFSRACEMFILEMTMRAWNNTVGHKRRTLQKCDIAAAILQTEIFDFLVDIIPGDDTKEEAKAEPAFPYCFFPPQPQGAAAGTSLMTLLTEPVDHYAWEEQQFAEPEIGGCPKSDE